jgi:hypothetical protein
METPKKQFVVDYDDCIIYEYDNRFHDRIWDIFYDFNEAKESLINYWIKAVQDSKINLQRAKKLKEN